jgi:hypothetical protein
MPKKEPGDLKKFILHVRFTLDQRDLLLFAAGREERELSDWVRRLALKEATRIKGRATDTSALVAGPLLHRPRRLKIGG